MFTGANVRSGEARYLLVATERSIDLGPIAHKLSLRRPPTEFDRGIRHFGCLLTIAMLTIVLVVFVAHALRGYPRDRDLAVLDRACGRLSRSWHATHAHPCK